MAPFESLEQAAAALAEANTGEAPATEAPETPVASEQAPADAERASHAESAPETTQQVEAEGATLEDSFTKVDLTSLTEGLEPEVAARVEEAYKSFQADYTRKTQEIAPLRKLASEVGDLDDLRQSVEFVQNLRSDPDFAVAVHRELSSALQEAGLTEAEAHAEASAQLQDAAEDDPFSNLEFDSEDPRDLALQELLEFKESYEAEQEERALEAEIQRMEMAIRQSNPDYTDDDMDEIVKLSFAYGGDLFRAEKDYSALRDRFLSSYVAEKESVTTRTPAPTPPTRHAEQPRKMSFDDAHKAAHRYLAEVLGS